MVKRILAPLLAIAIMAAGTAAGAADCGDTAGPAGERAPCACGDRVITNTVLRSTEAVVTAHFGVCVRPGNADGGGNRGRGNGAGQVTFACVP